MSSQAQDKAWLPQSRAGGQGLYLRSLDLSGRSSEAEGRKTPKKLGVTDGRTDKAGCSRVAHD